MIFSPSLKFRSRIAISFVVLLILWSSFLYFGVQAVLNWRLDREYLERGADAAAMALAEATPHVASDEAVPLGELPSRLMRERPNIRYVVVEDPSGTVLASSFPDRGIPADLRNLSYEEIPSRGISFRLTSAGDDIMYSYYARRGPAAVRLGYSLQAARDLVSLVSRSLLWLGALGIVAVLVAAYRISRPLEILSETIGNGKLALEPGSNAFAHAPPEARRILSRFEELHGELHEASAQLETARKLAYLGELSASLAHEVNNPLGIIVLNSGLLSRRCDAGDINGEAAEEVRMLRLASRRATLAVQGLLQFTRYSMSGGRPREQVLRIRPMVEETLELLRDRFRAGEIHVTAEVAEDLPDVLCDESGLQQVLFNLLLNSLEACGCGGHVTVSAGLTDQELLLRVMDDGRGMSENELSQAKAAFFTTKTQPEGLGLGLAISNSIVTANGGSLELKSRAGAGTEAIVRVPVRRAK